MDPADLTPDQRERYDRNLRLAEVGEAGQRRLLESSALIVGAGGLGSPAILYLAAAGIGRLGILDGERLERSNLNRQVLHRTADLGRPKADSAARRVRGLNPALRVEVFAERLTEAGARDRVRGWDVVLDCTDNFPTRLVLADACWREGRGLVSAAAIRFEGWLLSVLPAAGSPCYRCLVPEPPGEEVLPAARTVGVFGAAPGVLGALQAMEAVKLLLGIGQNLAHHLLIYDGLEGTFRTVRRARDPACPVCGEKTRA
jgi:adenylyltransferase/sulfurtransferase